MSDTLEKYTLVQAEKAAFEAEHAYLLNLYADLNIACDAAEAELKRFARSNGPEENAQFVVTVQPKSRRWFDTDYILDNCPWIRDVPGVIVQAVDKGKVEALVKGGMIPEGVAKAAQCEEALTAAVSIKAKANVPA
ncbi:MAG: hypothetical protein HYY29_03540 [Chloroflexi bacterium]|nr:hypothetical protein [Chloroflexota bacterium]